MNIDHITYFGGTEEEASKFYGEILGLETKIVDGNVWAQIGDEFIRHLSPLEKTQTGGNCHFAVKVDNVFEIAKRAAVSGCVLFKIVDGEELPIAQIDKEINQFFVRDFAGNMVEILA